ncbi:MAG: FAD-binding oxidoreductase, partial [Candidatus Omnitrophica bacterium]|nr:FAD-binding oxidoreductase [Candidatus Omnitrophota bacterium]
MVLIILLNLTLITFTLFLIFMERLLIRYGECKVIINKEKTYSAEEGETLLEFLGRKKIFIPSACGGKATCGHCKVKVLSGAGNILPTEKVFVNLEEAKSGVRLACQIKIKEPVEIYLPEYLFAAKEYMGRVIEKKDLTYDIKFLRIKLLNQERINFKAGQYIQLKIPGTEEFRAYSIASPPYIDDYLELIVRLIPGGLCSTYVHMALEIGDIVNFAGPFGEFFLHEESEKEIICVGGGSGMAPLRSII